MCCSSTARRSSSTSRPGSPSIPGSRTPESLEDYLKHFRFGFKRAPLPVHRLDRDTSGCLLLARNPKAHKRFQRAFENKAVTKTYLAVLDGIPDGGAEGVIDIPLGKVSTEAEGWRMVPDPAGKPALTRWRTLAVRDGRAVILFSPETGRTHQIRVHAKEGLGLPIAGDPVYGGSNGPMLLHALSIRVDRDGKPPVEATAPLPPTFLNAGLSDVLDGEPAIMPARAPTPTAPPSRPSQDLGDVLDD